MLNSGEGSRNDQLMGPQLVQSGKRSQCCRKGAVMRGQAWLPVTTCSAKANVWLALGSLLG